jgi:hypothetical protein
MAGISNHAHSSDTDLLRILEESDDNVSSNSSKSAVFNTEND